MSFWLALANLLALGIPVLLCASDLPARAPADGREVSAPRASGPPAPDVARDDSGPRIRVLGTVQDGGLPHAACACARCEAARRDPSLRRWIASLAVIFPADQKVFLIDATPDIRPQLDALTDARPRPAESVDRAPLDGVLLTHAHMGHYTGLMFLGFEAVNARDLLVFCTPRMTRFLRSNGPWDQLVRLGNVTLREARPGRSFTLHGEVAVTPLAVPHREEYTDTVGYLLRGPRVRGPARRAGVSAVI